MNEGILSLDQMARQQSAQVMLMSNSDEIERAITNAKRSERDKWWRRQWYRAAAQRRRRAAELPVGWRSDRGR